MARGMPKFSHMLLVTVALLALGFAAANAEPDAEMSPEQLEAELQKINEEIEKLRKEHDEVFQMGDLDKDGSLSPVEFRKIQKAEEPNDSDEEINESFADHDADGNGGLSIEEWRVPFEDTVHRMMNSGGEEEEYEQQIAHHRAEFDDLDADHDGNLDLKELETLSSRIGEHETPVSAQEILQAVDHDGDGKVSFEEFVMDGAGDEEYEEDPTELSLEDITS